MFQKKCVFLQRNREKSGFRDALAYYFALSQKCLRNSFWNIHEIIEVRLPEQSGCLPTVLSYAHAFMAWHVLITRQAGVPFSQARPTVKRIRMATPFFMSLLLLIVV